MRNTYLILYLLSSIYCQNDTVTNTTTNNTIIKETITPQPNNNNSTMGEFNLTYYEQLEKKYYENLDKVGKPKKDQAQLDEEEKEAKEWEQKIQNYFPENLLTVTVEPGDNEFFYDDIDIVPNKIMLAFYVHDEEEKIDFEISHNKVVLHGIKNKSKYFYELEVDKAGTYTFVLRNSRVIF
jgi:hypothetical protein